ncbi:hypothetical protein KUL150_18690 [Alteromonas sp. KUL150]|uniref:hypothetical protein n=1 Tax=Alteromonas sp. KUL150 TaxID=2480805 RepID=UPI0012E485A3|nr:hypothetical protein [Alteromonas sp. KUL150]GFD85810.1 hypothetical protein KUL150_18690 [Alteromonas sp. KUL150]
MKLKYFILSCLLLLSFLTGQYLKERTHLEAKITGAQPEIAVTEVLLKNYLASCDKEGYRRFTTFHEHNIDMLYEGLLIQGAFLTFWNRRCSIKCEKFINIIKKAMSFQRQTFSRSVVKFGSQQKTIIIAKGRYDVCDFEYLIRWKDLEVVNEKQTETDYKQPHTLNSYLGLIN